MYQYRMAVCEDDETVREGICGFCDRILTEEQIPHQIAAFSSAEELEACLAENRGSDEPAFHLLILDILMGEKTGMELAMEIREQLPLNEILYAEANGNHGVRFILKNGEE